MSVSDINSNKIGIIVQARMGSTRLPGKVAIKVGGREYLRHQILRILDVFPKTNCVIATTTSLEDNVVAEIARSSGVLFFRGSEDNVLQRYVQTAEQFGFNHVVRVTGDCPVIDPFIIKRVLDCYLKNIFHKVYVSNTISRSYPRGMDVEITSTSILQECEELSETISEKEHVTPIVRQGRVKGVNLINVADELNRSQWRFTLDTQEDHLQLSKIIEGIPSYDLESVYQYALRNNLLLPDTI